MVISYEKEHKFFISLYFLTITILLLDQVDTFTLGALLRKIKYVYILLMFVYMVYKHIFTKKQLLAILPLFILSLYAILWGTVFKNYNLPDLSVIDSHVKECLVFYAFVLVTYYYVSLNKCILLFAELSYISLIIVFIFAVLTHIADCVNPYYFIYIFNASARIRSTFGFSAWGYIGNYAYSAVALSLIIFHKTAHNRTNFMVIIGLAFGDFLALYMACSAASRSTIIATIITCFYYFIFEKIWVQTSKGIYILLITAFILITIYLIYYFITHATRNLNITGNMEAFHQVGNFWTGMGYIENHGYQDTICAFGVPTTSLDISYVYYYFSTGTLGCIFLGVAGIGFLVMIILSASGYKIPVLTIFIAMLFYAYWQVNLFTYTYYSNLFYLVIYMSVFTLGKNKAQKESMVRIYL